MRWRTKSFWLNSLIIFIFIFAVSEIVLRFLGYTGVFSMNALYIITSSARRLLLLLDNLVLFIIVIFLPIILAAKFTKNQPVNEKFRYATKKKFENKQKISVKTINKHSSHLEYKGLLIGAIIGILYTFIDFFFIKPSIPECNSLCGFENVFAALFSLFYLATAIIMMRNHN